MLIDQSAYSNRWRQVSPAAKAVFCLSGMTAAFAARSPWLATAVAVCIAATTIIGAGIPVGRYLRTAAPPLCFLGISSLTLIVSFDGIPGLGNGQNITLTSAGIDQAAQLCGRAVASLASLLFLALTTPMTEIISLLRRLKLPDLLLDMTIIGYRMLFVFSDVTHQIRTAQAARLGYASNRHTIRSLGQLIAAVTLQVWQRAAVLELAAQARCTNGTLRFLSSAGYHTGRDLAVSLSAGACLITIALLRI
ncbi:cobalt ECF transporter T component CbiQ [Trichlorobacter lovleyi]|uniref:cobalt ECF transporter T component CbiQ n=1 Tax=Trichlorobacter lovleyi TaxID=313985 RepID=UPI0023F3AFF7|nr:cobalt ECF transporter T component CbiQ [Trichlorobacter lovleyi]